MTTPEKLAKCREYFKNYNVDALIVPLSDPHFNEYIQEHFKALEWLSGFTGSAATLLVTKSRALLWSDSRYFLQGEEQLKGSGVEFMRGGEAGVPAPIEWIETNMQKGSVVAIDSALISYSQFKLWKEQLSIVELRLVRDPFATIWSDRAAMYHTQGYVMPTHYSGESSLQKRERLFKRLVQITGVNRATKEEGRGFAYLLSSCDDIAWFCNMRGEDLPFNPLLYSYLVVERERATLFISNESLNGELLEHLKSSKIDIEEYSSITNWLEELSANVTIVTPFNKISCALHSSASMGGRQLIDDSLGVVAHMKAIKNSVEIEGFKLAMVKDGVAWVRVLMELENRLLDVDNPIVEGELAQLFAQKRSLENEYRSESFSPIVAFGANGALPHYSFSNDNPVAIGKRGFLLMDTGAQYLHGTTDTTRTLFIGTPSREEILDYTMVLKGMINLSRARFLEGSCGHSLDILARGQVYKRGKVYLHGTGHGVGHHLPVHEGPQSIRREVNSTPIQVGMVLSNEPAIYQEGEYGIRIENLLLCTHWMEANSLNFFNFETLTLVPIETKCIDTKALGEKGVNWINRYHQRVYKALSPHLTTVEKEWLALKCLPITIHSD